MTKTSGSKRQSRSSKGRTASRSNKSIPLMSLEGLEKSSLSDPDPVPQKPEAVKFTLTGKQDLAFQHLTDNQDKQVLYGGAKGGGKSYLFCAWVFFWATHLIKLFDLKNNPPSSPIPIGFIGRKRAVDFDKTTLETFRRIIPADEYRINSQAKEIVIWEVVKIFYGGLDDQDTINKFNSAENAFIAIDQAEETDRTDVAVLQGSLRLRINGVTPPYKELYTANPAECWLKNDFIIAGKGIYIPALFSDNPHLPTNYEATLQRSFGFDDVLLRAYKDGDWDAVQADSVLIPSSTIEALKNRTVLEVEEKDGVVCDPSLGGDECVIYRMRNTKILQTKIMHEKDTMKIVGQCDFMMREIACRNFVVDSIGIGAGIGDRMKELEWDVYKLVSSKSSEDPKYTNIREEMWMYASQLIRQGKCEYPEDEELRRQLSGVRFKIQDSNGAIKLEPKDTTKKRLGRSPDRADAFVMWLWAKDHCHFGGPEGTFKRKRFRNLQRTYSANTVI